MKQYTAFQNLAPMIHRQRLVVEGTPTLAVGAQTIADYLRRLGKVLDMRVLTDPVTHRSERYGWAGWVHWETSGTHVYAWEQPILFVSIDIYTCKPFDPRLAREFTRSELQLTKVTTKEF